jgi:hypothetical protein
MQTSHTTTLELTYSEAVQLHDSIEGGKSEAATVIRNFIFVQFLDGPINPLAKIRIDLGVS